MNPINLFIDTNVLLGFFHFSKDTLEELRKVLVLQSYGKINLWLPEQVKLEFLRNREVKIAEALKKFQETSANYNIPRLVQDYPECTKLMDALRLVSTSREELMVKVREDISERSLSADTLISKIFKEATTIDTKSSYFEKAKRRSDLRSPPGKNNSLGDAINWEALLDTVPRGQDISLISEDSDFSSPLNAERLSDFLYDEWLTQKQSDIVLYRRLSQFLSAKFPDARFAAEIEKNILISELAISDSFATTHYLIAKLNRFDKFSGKQVSDIVEAYMTNSQVSWITSDEDVRDFGKRLADNHTKAFEPEQRTAFLTLLGSAP